MIIIAREMAHRYHVKSFDSEPTCKQKSAETKRKEEKLKLRCLACDLEFPNETATATAKARCK